MGAREVRDSNKPRRDRRCKGEPEEIQKLERRKVRAEGQLEFNGGERR